MKREREREREREHIDGYNRTQNSTRFISFVLVSNKWIREIGQAFRRRCGLKRNSKDRRR